eukprot:3105441-Alexandrium_andersonii.AAC.1
MQARFSKTSSSLSLLCACMFHANNTYVSATKPRQFARNGLDSWGVHGMRQNRRRGGGNGRERGWCR